MCRVRLRTAPHRLRRCLNSNDVAGRAAAATGSKEALNKFFCRHAGESRHPGSQRKPLDSGFRRNDENGTGHLFRASLTSKVRPVTFDVREGKFYPSKFRRCATCAAPRSCFCSGLTLLPLPSHCKSSAGSSFRKRLGSQLTTSP